MFKGLFDLLSVIALNYFNGAYSNLRSGPFVPFTPEKLDPHIFREEVQELSARIDFVKQTRASNNYIHEVVFVIPQRNMIELTRILNDISDPESLNYGQHITKENVKMLTSNQESSDTVVEYLRQQGANITPQTLHGEYVTAKAPIAVWEKIFNTEFYMFHQMDGGERINEVVRTERYWIPREIDLHVESVLKTIDVPIIGLKDGFDGWILEIANMKRSSLILNINYLLDEKFIPDSYHKAFTAEAIKLGCMGITIFVASGEDGANLINMKRKELAQSCGYSALWPATNPYVTAIGSTSTVRNIIDRNM